MLVVARLDNLGKGGWVGRDGHGIALNEALHAN